MSDSKKYTLVIGASENTERYAYKAADRLREHGHPFDLLSNELPRGRAPRYRC